MIESVHDWRWLLFILMIIAAVGDIRSYRIPNILPIAVVASLALALVVNATPAEQFAAALVSGLIGLAVGYGFFALGLMGGGDGKLFAAAAAWFNASALLYVGLFVSVAGVLVALAALAVRTARRTPASAGSAGGAIKVALKTPVPYGVAIALGVIAAAQLPQ